MSAISPVLLRQLFEWEQHANQSVLDSFRSIPEPPKDAEARSRAMNIHAHTLAARLLWLHRLGILEGDPVHPFPEVDSIDALESMGGEVQTHWNRYLGSLPATELARPFHYRDVKGNPFSSTIQEILIQLLTHAPYHRGQIAMLVRRAGGTPAITDYVYATRRPVSS